MPADPTATLTFTTHDACRLRSGLRAAMDASWEQSEEVYRWLAERERDDEIARLRDENESLRLDCRYVRASFSRASAIEDAAVRLTRNVQSYFPQYDPDKASFKLSDVDNLRAALAIHMRDVLPPIAPTQAPAERECERLRGENERLRGGERAAEGRGAVSREG